MPLGNISPSEDCFPCLAAEQQRGLESESSGGDEGHNSAARSSVTEGEPRDGEAAEQAGDNTAREWRKTKARVEGSCGREAGTRIADIAEGFHAKKKNNPNHNHIGCSESNASYLFPRKTQQIR